MLPSQESRVKTFAENKGKEDTRMDIIIPPQDAVGSFFFLRKYLFTTCSITY